MQRCDFWTTKTMSRIGGIYQIKNLTTLKVYIGSAKYIKSRWSQHVCSLRRGTHDNSYLQAAWNKYGEYDFEFSVLEIVEDQDSLASIEQKWMNETECNNRELGYNLRIEATNNKGIQRRGTPLTKEHIAFLRSIHTDKIVSDETRERISAWQKGIVPTWATKAAALVTRNYDKWPCETGCHCRCPTCKETLNVSLRAWRKAKYKKEMEIRMENTRRLAEENATN